MSEVRTCQNGKSPNRTTHTTQCPTVPGTISRWCQWASQSAPAAAVAVSSDSQSGSTPRKGQDIEPELSNGRNQHGSYQVLHVAVHILLHARRTAVMALLSSNTKQKHCTDPPHTVTDPVVCTTLQSHTLTHEACRKSSAHSPCCHPAAHGAKLLRIGLVTRAHAVFCQLCR